MSSFWIGGPFISESNFCKEGAPKCQSGLRTEVQMEAKFAGRARNHTHKMIWKQEGLSGTHSERNGAEKKTNGGQMMAKWC